MPRVSRRRPGAVPIEPTRHFAFYLSSSRPVAVAHFIAVEVFHVVHAIVYVPMLAARRQMPVIAVMRIEVVIHMAAEVHWPVEPWAGADEHAIREPFRPVIAIGSAIIGRIIEIAVRASRRRAYVHTHTDLSSRLRSSSEHRQQRGACQKTNHPEAHKFALLLCEITGGKTRQPEKYQAGSGLPFSQMKAEFGKDAATPRNLPEFAQTQMLTKCEKQCSAANRQRILTQPPAEPVFLTPAAHTMPAAISPRVPAKAVHSPHGMSRA